MVQKLHRIFTANILRQPVQHNSRASSAHRVRKFLRIKQRDIHNKRLRRQKKRQTTPRKEKQTNSIRSNQRAPCNNFGWNSLANWNNTRDEATDNIRIHRGSILYPISNLHILAKTRNIRRHPNYRHKLRSSSSRRSIRNKRSGIPLARTRSILPRDLSCPWKKKSGPLVFIKRKSPQTKSRRIHHNTNEHVQHNRNNTTRNQLHAIRVLRNIQFTLHHTSARTLRTIQI